LVSSSTRYVIVPANYEFCRRNPEPPCHSSRSSVGGKGKGKGGGISRSSGSSDGKYGKGKGGVPSPSPPSPRSVPSTPSPTRICTTPSPTPTPPRECEVKVSRAFLSVVFFL
jgi:hypothetical protein